MLRIHKQRTRAALIRALEAAPGVAAIPDEWEDMVFVETTAGQQVVIYLYDRQIERDEVLQSFHTNTKQGLHTLYILSAAMLLPEHGDIYRPEDWMALLAALHGGKIYSYRVMRLVVDITPAYFRPVGPRFEVQYGERIDVNGLQCFPVLLDGAEVLLADFELLQTVAPAPKATAQGLPMSPAAPDFYATDPYVVLGLPADADRVTIKATFRELARRYHPDIDATPGAKTRMQALNRAYRALMTSEKS